VTDIKPPRCKCCESKSASQQVGDPSKLQLYNLVANCCIIVIIIILSHSPSLLFLLDLQSVLPGVWLLQWVYSSWELVSDVSNLSSSVHSATRWRRCRSTKQRVYRQFDAVHRQTDSVRLLREGTSMPGVTVAFFAVISHFVLYASSFTK